MVVSRHYTPCFVAKRFCKKRRRRPCPGSLNDGISIGPARDQYSRTGDQVSSWVQGSCGKIKKSYAGHTEEIDKESRKRVPEESRKASVAIVWAMHPEKRLQKKESSGSKRIAFCQKRRQGRKWDVG